MGNCGSRRRKRDEPRERLGRLTEELTAALTAGEAVDDAALAARFAVAADDVAICRRALDCLRICLDEDPVDGPPELPRPTLPERYRLEDELGRGGMGVVYRAPQPELGCRVAVNVLPPRDLRFGDALRRFRNEARSLARLRHCHIVSIHDLGEPPEGLVWFAMDLVDGGSGYRPALNDSRSASTADVRTQDLAESDSRGPHRHIGAPDYRDSGAPAERDA